MKISNVLSWIFVLICPLWTAVYFTLYGIGSSIVGGFYRIGINPGTPEYSYDIMVLGFNISQATIDFGIITIIFIIPSLIANYMLDKMDKGGAHNPRMKYIIWISPLILTIFSLIQTVLSVLFATMYFSLPAYLLVGLMHWLKLKKMKST
ncbi:MAG: hypothetical protein ACFFEF_18535 [Candidatus Thorarchaeota archaeon]